ncbi:MAG: glycosyltransferase family 4 protein [Tannerellaceae bacterium]|jgi:glycosyltransferase involved in cell wall biosynthesis|nr:glycosyltransferase family 4 protein [Tannerellaceae bacterium]
MKIYVFGTRGFPHMQGGVETHCEKLYTALPESFQITVFRRKSFLPPHAEKQLRHIRFIDVVSTKRKGFETFFHSFLCACICIVKRPDVVHIHNIGPGLFTPLLAMFGIPVVLTYHSPNYEHQKWGGMARAILRLGERLSLAFSSRIIFVNQFQRNKYPEKIINKSIFLPNGVDREEPVKNRDYIDSLGLTPQRYILTIGRITQEKGHDYLIDAFNLLDRQDVKLVLAGGADYSQEYSVQIMNKAKQENIVMTGYVHGDKLSQLYSHAKLFVFPSYNEGFPIALLEAMNYRLPIIASDIPANKQLRLPEDCFFKTGDIDALKDKMEGMLNKDIGAYPYDLTEYDWRKIAEHVSRLYEQAVNETID